MASIWLGTSLANRCQLYSPFKKKLTSGPISPVFPWSYHWTSIVSSKHETCFVSVNAQSSRTDGGSRKFCSEQKQIMPKPLVVQSGYRGSFTSHPQCGTRESRGGSKTHANPSSASCRSSHYCPQIWSCKIFSPVAPVKATSCPFGDCTCPVIASFRIIPHVRGQSRKP